MGWGRCGACRRRRSGCGRSSRPAPRSASQDAPRDAAQSRPERAAKAYDHAAIARRLVMPRCASCCAIRSDPRGATPRRVASTRPPARRGSRPRRACLHRPLCAPAGLSLPEGCRGCPFAPKACLPQPRPACLPAHQSHTAFRHERRREAGHCRCGGSASIHRTEALLERRALVQAARRPCAAGRRAAPRVRAARAGVRRGAGAGRGAGAAPEPRGGDEGVRLPGAAPPVPRAQAYVMIIKTAASPAVWLRSILRKAYHQLQQQTHSSICHRRRRNRQFSHGLNLNAWFHAPKKPQAVCTPSKEEC